MEILPLSVKGCIGRYASSIHDIKECAGDNLVLDLTHESLTTMFLPCFTCRGTDRENSGPGLQMMSSGDVSFFIK